MTKELQVRNTPPLFHRGNSGKKEKNIYIYIYLTKVILILDFRPPLLLQRDKKKVRDNRKSFICR